MKRTPKGGCASCWEVRLSKNEVELTRTVGELRQHVNDANDREGCYLTGDIGESHRVGALGEWVVSRVLKLPWDGMFFHDNKWKKWRRKGHDVGPFETKSTTCQNGHLLIPEDNDVENKLYVSVIVGMDPAVDLSRVVGWCRGEEVKVPSHYKIGTRNKPYYQLPKDKLRPVEELRPLLTSMGISESVKMFCDQCATFYYGDYCPLCWALREAKLCGLR